METLKQLRQELVTRAEIYCPESNDAAMRAIAGAGFERIDTGIVYRQGATANQQPYSEDTVIIRRSPQ